MAKKSKIARNEQRKVIVERYAERRLELKKTLVDPNAVEVVSTADLTFKSGGDLRDSDTYATKGALFTRVRHPSGAELDVVSTHLLAGGEWLPLPGAA